MRIGLTYNLKSDCPQELRVVTDGAAEFDTAETVDRIAWSLQNAGHEVVRIAFNKSLLQELSASRLDFVFNIAEGWFGRTREALVPQVLEFLGIPYLGSDPATLAVCLDKALAKHIVRSCGVPTADFAVVRSLSDLDDIALNYPLFVKPVGEGSSKGIRRRSRVEDSRELVAVVSDLLQCYHQPVLVEEFLPGREFTVGLIGNGPSTRTFPIMEIVPAEPLAGEDFVYCFDTKTGNRERLLCPAPVDGVLAQQLREYSLLIYQMLPCYDFARIDFRLDADGTPNFLEINPLPGLGVDSLYPGCAQAAGLTFDQLICELTVQALERYRSLPWSSVTHI